jgi:hypothetical protein
MKRSLRHPLLDRDSNPGAPRISAKGTRRRLRSRRVRLPVVPSAFTAKNGASLRQGMVKRSCSTGLSYGPPVLGPAGFEPATTSLRGCSSTCIRNATSNKRDKGRQDVLPVPVARHREFDLPRLHVVLPAFASNLHSFQSSCPTARPTRPSRSRRPSAQTPSCLRQTWPRA